MGDWGGGGVLCPQRGSKVESLYAKSVQRPNSWTTYRKSPKSFLLAIHSHLYSFGLRFLFLQSHETSYSFYSSVTIHSKEKGGKPERKPNPLPYG
jgi:hypothetical protein